MASVVIQISKKLPEEELFEVLKGVCEQVGKKYSDFSQVNKDKLKEETISNLTALLENEQEIKERFTLVGYIFIDNLLDIVQALETNDKSLQSMQALSTLYTIAHEGYSRFRIFKSITLIARREPSLLTLIQPHLQKVEKFVASWKSVPIPELSEFIQSLLNLNISDKKRATLIFQLLIEGGLEGEASDQVIAKLIQSTTEFEVSDLITFPGFQKSSEVVKRLVEIISEKTVDEIVVYWDKHVDVLQNKGFSKEKVIEVGRIAGIVKLASENNKVSFNDLATRLGVRENEVDQWVVRAISGGLVKGKIDTIGKIITFDFERVQGTKKSALEMLNKLEEALTS